jgi:excisionase family DNA binding protein
MGGNVMDEQMLTTAQVAERLQVTQKTVVGWIQAGKLTAYKLSRLWRVKESDLEAFLEARKGNR